MSVSAAHPQFSILHSPFSIPRALNVRVISFIVAPSAYIVNASKTRKNALKKDKTAVGGSAHIEKRE